jgi:predicted O-methyltransferase YrrM
MHTFWQYIRYFFRAGNAHGLHSPFVYQLFTEIIEPDKWYTDFDMVEDLRANLLNDTTKLEVTDFGAGSKGGNHKTKMISDITLRSTSQPYVSHLLFKLVDFFQPKTIIELGTSLGVNTMYLGLAATRQAKIYSFEGCPQIAAQAHKFLANSPQTAQQVEIIVGNIDQTLPQKLQEITEPLNFVFFDANHRYQPTMNYFELCLAKANQDSVFIFDDIYWSSEMTKAWEEIKAHPQVRVSIDLFQLGIVFFRTQQEKQHFCLKFG